MAKEGGKEQIQTDSGDNLRPEPIDRTQMRCRDVWKRIESRTTPNWLVISPQAHPPHSAPHLLSSSNHPPLNSASQEGTLRKAGTNIPKSGAPSPSTFWILEETRQKVLVLVQFGSVVSVYVVVVATGD